MTDAIFSQIDFGPIKEFLEDDIITDISYSNGGQVWLKSLDKGVYKVERPEINNLLMEKLAFQCSNVMGKTFNMAHPFLDAESSELRLNFVHDSIATNGIACVIRKTPAKIRLNKSKLLDEQYLTAGLHEFLFKCVEGHCNIIVSGETGSGKTELVKYLAAHTRTDEKVITIEDTLELHLDRIFPHRDIVAMKTNNIASYSDVLVTCMRQNPRWILLSEVRSAEAVMAVRNSISSGHNIISTIHSDKASGIPMRMYSLLETNLEIDQFLKTVHRYVQIGIHVKGYLSKALGRFQREIVEVCEFFVSDENTPEANVIYKKSIDGTISMNKPSKNLINYLGFQGIELDENMFEENWVPENPTEGETSQWLGGDSPKEESAPNNIPPTETIQIENAVPMPEQEILTIENADTQTVMPIEQTNNSSVMTNQNIVIPPLNNTASTIGNIATSNDTNI